MTIEIRALQPKHFAATNALWSFTRGIVLRGDDNPEYFRQFLLRNPDYCHGAWNGGDLLVGAIMTGHDCRRGTSRSSKKFISNRFLFAADR
jgi:hypothetical protein